MQDFINYQEIITSVISSLLVTIITTIIGAVFVNKYFSQISFSRKLKKLGFLNTSTNAQSRFEIEHMCKNAYLIKIINVSGFHYLNRNKEQLKKALAAGVEIRFLSCKRDSVFLKDIEELEYNRIDASGNRVRERNKRISSEITELRKVFKNSGLQMRYYTTEYRLPYVLAYYNDGSVKAWLTVTLPPYKSTKSFVLRGKRTEEQESSDINFIDMMETNFDSIWENSTMEVDNDLR